MLEKLNIELRYAKKAS